MPILALFLWILFAGQAPSEPRAPRYQRSPETPSIAIDLLIFAGRVIDGSGTQPFVADIGVHDDRIVFIGDAEKAGLSSTRSIDATGLLVAPGFIDPHTHTLADLADTSRRSLVNYLLQGVTTVITGNDGGGPVAIANRLEIWQKYGTGVNVGLLIGHGSIRRQIVGMSRRRPTDQELMQMKDLAAQAMDEGALGLSTGLYYAPGSFAETEEVIELAKVVARKGGIYDSHIRDESDYNIGLIGAIKEAIRIGAEANIPVNISHIKALGPGLWHQSGAAIEIIKAARAQGLRITADQYPYLASGTSISGALIPRWALAGGADSLRMRLRDPAARGRIEVDMRANLHRRGGAETLLITSSGTKALVGKTLADIAGERSQDPIETAIELQEAGGGGLASFNMHEDDLINFMKQDFVMTGSDGSTGHPRKYGSFPRKIRKYVFEQKDISLPFAIRSSSALAAQTFGLDSRGLLQKGYFADIIVFDPELTDRATFLEPRLHATGVRDVIVNGQVVVANEEYLGILAGRALRPSPAVAQ